VVERNISAIHGSTKNVSIRNALVNVMKDLQHLNTAARLTRGKRTAARHHCAILPRNQSVSAYS
jgi:hypothetical protein